MKLIALPLALLALTASTPPPVTTVPASLAGTKWTIAAIDGAKPVKADASLSFEADAISANIGCNGMGGAYHLEGSTLVAGPIISTQMYCDGVMEQERAVSALLGAKPQVTLINGRRLILVTKDHRIKLNRAN